MVCAEARAYFAQQPGGTIYFGIGLVAKQSWAKRLNILDAAARLAPHNSEIQYNLGLVLLLHGQTG